MNIATVYAAPQQLNNSDTTPTPEPPKAEQVVKTEERPVEAEKPKQEEPPKAEPHVKPQAVSQPAAPSGSCEAEIRKYNWRQDIALAVAKAESGLRPGAHNFSHKTKDNSWGCFQINIYGANARTRPPASELVKAHVNVAFAYKIYVANGHSFIGQWGVCRAKVSCY